MDPQLQHPQVHRYGDDHHHQHMNLEGENEQHGEKKSVLKKVKTKAKKIKETIKMHAGHLHGHEHDHHGHHPDHDDDEDEYEDEETDHVEDTEVLGTHFARNPMAHPEGPNLERTDEPTAGKDHTRQGVPSSHAHGLGTGFTEESSIGRLIIPEEAPLAPRSTPVSHGEDHQRVAAHGLEQPSRCRKIPDDSPPLIAGETVEHDSARQGSYTEKLAYVTASLADHKVVAAKDVAASKLGYGDEKKNETDGQSDRSQTSYTEKASQAASLLTEKAIGVKDVIASKLGGYGGAEEHKTPHEPVDHEALIQQKQSSYMGKISGVGSVLADKAVGAKNAVASKLAATEGTTWSDKLKPGDEDKALSELICSTFYKGGSTHQGDVKEPASDAVHKRADEHDDDDESRKKVEVKLMGRVTESEEVARRLGTSDEEKRGEVTYVPGDGSPSKPVADMIKSAVSSWWTANNQTPQQHPRDTSESGTGERRLQESAN